MLAERLYKNYEVVVIDDNKDDCNRIAENNSNFNIMVRSGSCNFNVNGNVNMFVNDDINMTCDNFRLDASNKVSITSGDRMLLDSSGENDINGNPINLN